MEALKVSDLVGRIKRNLENSHRSLLVEGQVTNFSRSSTGHYYFTLSDESSSVSCTAFRADAARFPTIRDIKDGDKIVVSGSLGVYARRGTFQIVVRSVAVSGRGGLKEEFAKLKTRLSREGLFDISHKKPVPVFARKIALITASTGAALRDFLGVFSRRSLFMDILVIDSPVQGDRAAKALRAALHRAIKYSLEVQQIDAIVLTRGGGSLEELWAFNDEALAWDIHACPIPVVSAVGHQVDFSIADFVSDLRCESPSAAAERLSQGQTTLKMSLDRAGSLFDRFPTLLLAQTKERLGYLSPLLLLRHIKDSLFSHIRSLEALGIHRRMGEALDLRDAHFRIDELALRLESAVGFILSSTKARSEKNGALLTGFDPAGVLSRGFSYVVDSRGCVVASAKDFRSQAPGSRLSLSFHDGIGQVEKI